MITFENKIENSEFYNSKTDKRIHDIFSKKTEHIEEKNEKIKMIVDHREKNSLVISNLVKMGVEIEFKQLPVADFLVKDTAIERKTVSDFISSMINRRLINQLEELQQYESKILLIEGLESQELYSKSSNINQNAIRGFLLSIILKYKVPIIFSKNEEDTAEYLVILAKKQEREMGIRAIKKARNTKEQIQYIIEGFPGIGPKTARKLLEKYKTIKNIINTPIEEIEEIIGKKSEIFKILAEEY